MSLLSFAQDELERVGFGDDDSKVMLEILKKFFDRWDSGGAVHVASDVLVRLLACQPLSPLTGAEHEWADVSMYGQEPVWQNCRCPSVFKDSTGRAYDIDTPGRPTITFPYDPTTKLPPDPVIVVQS